MEWVGSERWPRGSQSSVRLHSTRSKQLLPLPSAACPRTGDGWGWGGGMGAALETQQQQDQPLWPRWTHYSSFTWRAYLRPEGSIVVCNRTPQGFMSHEFPLWPGQMVTIVLAVACVRLWESAFVLMMNYGIMELNWTELQQLNYGKCGDWPCVSAWYLSFFFAPINTFPIT